jgi:ABC-type transport system involved in cytochrome c biogenesis permease subunit
MSDPSKKKNAKYAFNITLAAVAGQVGCLTLVIVLVALFAGLWLDNQFQSKPLFTVLLTVASVPVTLVMMFWVVRKATARMKTNSEREVEKPQEDANSGTDLS